MTKETEKPLDDLRAAGAVSATERTDPATSGPSSSGLSRRMFLASAAATAGVVSWSNLTIINKAKAAGGLRILAWPGYDEKPVVGEFEETNKVKVEFKNYIGGEQMLQYYRAGAERHLRRHHQRRRIHPEVRRPERPRATESGKLPESRPVPPEVPRLPAAAGAATARPGASPRASASTASPTTRSIVSEEEVDSWSNRSLPRSSRARW